MSTRGAIARINGDGFKGVYHHWDSYPHGLGVTLIHLAINQFNRDIEAMLKVLIDEHPAGWSHINGGDFSLPVGFIETDNLPCKICGHPQWEHYYQNWEGHNKRLTATATTAMTNSKYMALGHQPEYLRPLNAECYCHGDRHEEANEITEKNAADCGVEYVYAFDEAHKTMAVLSSYNEDGSKMIGMFGCGNPDAKWKVETVANLNDDLDRLVAGITEED